MLRNLAHFGGQYVWFYGIAFIPLAEVFALEFTVPVWTAVLATLLLGERITRERITAIFLGALGVVVILRPGLAVVNPASLAVLAEKPEIFGRTLIYLGLAEGIAIYGLVMSILLLDKI